MRELSATRPWVVGVDDEVPADDGVGRVVVVVVTAAVMAILFLFRCSMCDSLSH